MIRTRFSVTRYHGLLSKFFLLCTPDMFINIPVSTLSVCLYLRNTAICFYVYWLTQYRNYYPGNERQGLESGGLN